MSPVAELTAVGKRYGDTTALHDVSLTVEPGEILALVGPNGAGKTTLTRILATLLRPTSGRVVICGHDAATEQIRIRRSIAIVPQGVMPDPFTTPWEHAFYYLQARGYHRDAAAERCEAALTSLGLWDRRDVRAQYLSGGFQRRIILAMAIATRPRLLLLDEPTTALDPAARREVWAQLAALRPTTSILLTTHDMTEAEMLNDRIALISAGRLVTVDTLPALLDRLPAREKFVIGHTGTPPVAVDRYGDTQVVASRLVVWPRDPRAAKELGMALVQAGASFSAQPADLEDCYFHLLSATDRDAVVADVTAGADQL